MNLLPRRPLSFAVSFPVRHELVAASLGLFYSSLPLILSHERARSASAYCRDQILSTGRNNLLLLQFDPERLKQVMIDNTLLMTFG
jgi:hypothetical protein